MISREERQRNLARSRRLDRQREALACQETLFSEPPPSKIEGGALSGSAGSKERSERVLAMQKEAGPVTASLARGLHPRGFVSVVSALSQPAQDCVLPQAKEAISDVTGPDVPPWWKQFFTCEKCGNQTTAWKIAHTATRKCICNECLPLIGTHQTISFVSALARDAAPMPARHDGPRDFREQVPGLSGSEQKKGGEI